LPEECLPAAELAQDRVLGLDEVLDRGANNLVTVVVGVQKPNPLLKVSQISDQHVCVKAPNVDGLAVDCGRCRVGRVVDVEVGTPRGLVTHDFSDPGSACGRRCHCV